MLGTHYGARQFCLYLRLRGAGVAIVPRSERQVDRLLCRKNHSHIERTLGPPAGDRTRRRPHRLLCVQICTAFVFKGLSQTRVRLAVHSDSPSRWRWLSPWSQDLQHTRSRGVGLAGSACGDGQAPCPPRGGLHQVVITGGKDCLRAWCAWIYMAEGGQLIYGSCETH